MYVELDELCCSGPGEYCCCNMTVSFFFFLKMLRIDKETNRRVVKSTKPSKEGKKTYVGIETGVYRARETLCLVAHRVGADISWLHRGLLLTGGQVLQKPWG